MQKKSKIIIAISAGALVLLVFAAVLIYIGAKNTYSQTYPDFMHKYDANQSEFDYKDYFDISYARPSVDPDDADATVVGTAFYTINITNKTKGTLNFGVQMFAGKGYSAAGMPSLTQNSNKTISILPGQTAMLTATGDTSTFTTKPKLEAVADKEEYNDIYVEMHLNQKRGYFKISPTE